MKKKRLKNGRTLKKCLNGLRKASCAVFKIIVVSFSKNVCWFDLNTVESYNVYVDDSLRWRLDKR